VTISTLATGIGSTVATEIVADPVQWLGERMAETLSARMTSAEARRVQDEARVRGEGLVWFVSVTEGKARAWAVVADRHGGKRQPGELEADTLAELRALLPAAADAVGPDRDDGVGGGRSLGLRARLLTGGYPVRYALGGLPSANER
jgi:hypothetical protein